MAINALLLDIAKATDVVLSHATVQPGDLVFAHLAPPVPGDTTALGDYAFMVDFVRWRVTTTAPTFDANGFVNPLPPAATPGTDFTAPLGLEQAAAVFGLMPPFGAAAPAPKAYWLIAEFTLRRAMAVNVLDVLKLSVAKASPQINAAGFSGPELINKVLGLFKVDMPPAPVEPGASVTARLLPRGAEDAEWDVDAATDVMPNLELAAAIQLEPLLKPLSRIIGGVFGTTNEILGSGARLFAIFTRVFAALSKFFGRNIDRDLKRLLRRLRIRNVDIFKGLELPIDIDVVNRNFTKHLVPRDPLRPLPGPRGLLPIVPSLEKQLELTDMLPQPASAIPVVGTLSVPISISQVNWSLWRNPGPANQLTTGTDYVEVEHTAGRLFKRTFAIVPPMPADSVIYLQVIINYTVDPAAAAIAQAVTLPLVPVRLLGFDPLATIAQQLELSLPVDPLEPGEELQVQLLSSLLAAADISASGFKIPLAVGELPPLQASIQTTWAVLDQNVQPTLGEGSDFSVTGGTSVARSIVFVPIVQIMRREDAVPLFRYIEVTLALSSLSLPAGPLPLPVLPPRIVGPLPVPVLPLEVPLFIAGFKRRLFTQGDDEVTVVLPNFYTTQGPSWVESWETFRERLNDLKEKVERLLSIAGGTAAGGAGTAATPLPPGATQKLTDPNVRKFTLLRGALDYVANRPTSKQRLLFVNQSTQPNGDYRSESVQGENWKTIVVFNDRNTWLWVKGLFDLWSYNSIRVQGTPARPMCILWTEAKKKDPIYLWPFWTFDWIPKQPDWPPGEDAIVFYQPNWYAWRIHSVSFDFDQQLPINKYFPSPASLS